jgi:hypothetical protein
VGNTAHAASLHPSIEALEIVDLSEHVLRHGVFFEKTNHGVLKAPVTSVFVNDGRQHLRMQDAGIYDLITLEPPPIRFAGMSALYSVEFYEFAKRGLKEDGFMTQWMPINQGDHVINLAMVKAFLEVFPNAVLLEGFIDHFILLGRKSGSNEIDPEQILEAIQSRPLVLQDMESVWLSQPTEIVVTFLADSDHLRSITESIEPITDDRPAMEFFASSPPGPPRGFFAVDRVEHWCPDCFRDGEPVERVKDLVRYQEIRAAIFEGKNYKLGRGRLPMEKFDNEANDLKAMVEKYPYLQNFIAIPRS